MSKNYCFEVSDVEEMLLKEGSSSEKSKKMIEVTNSYGRLSFYATQKGLFDHALVLKPAQLGMEVREYSVETERSKSSFLPYCLEDNELKQDYDFAFLSNNLLNQPQISYEEKTKLLRTISNALKKNATFVVSILNPRSICELPLGQKHIWQENNCSFVQRNHQLELGEFYVLRNLEDVLSSYGFKEEQVLSIPPRKQKSKMKSASSFSICKKL